MRRRCGFTLLELLVVLVIMALLATGGLVGLSMQERAGHAAFTRDILRSLQAASRAARSQGAATAFVVDREARTYGPAGRPPRRLPTTVALRGQGWLESTDGRTFRLLFHSDGSVTGKESSRQFLLDCEFNPGQGSSAALERLAVDAGTGRVSLVKDVSP